ncbi:MAG: type III-A CRISPR-associated RAMP protein Csm5 [Candidatus Kapaibacteriales bacterium]
MKIRIKTLTPVHIGTGKKLSSLEFLNNHRINFDKLFDLLAEEKQDEFFAWIDQNPNLKINDIQKNFSLKSKDIIDKCALYSLPGTIQRDLNEGIKDSSYKLFIPGSSLKGSIRTALMYKVLVSNYDKTFLANFFDDLIKKSRSFQGQSNKIKNFIKSADDKLEQEVFLCGVKKIINSKEVITNDDQKYDLLKLLTVSDSESVETNTQGEISELQVYALNKSAPHKSFKTFTESITSNVELEFDISIDIEFLKKAKDELKKNNTDFGKKYFIGIEEKLKRLFDIDIINDEEFSEEKIVNTVIQAWLEFGNAVSNLEKKWVDSLKEKSSANISSLSKLYQTQNKIKVGFGTGFSGMTILPLLLNDPSLKIKAEEFYKAVEIGFHKSNNTPLSIIDFPFTRKYSNNQNIYGGFGWIQIIGNNISTISQNSTQEGKAVKRPPNTVIAEIIDDKSKPPKVKILEGKHKDEITLLPNVRLEPLGLAKNSKVFVELFFQKKLLQKADYKGKVE